MYRTKPVVRYCDWHEFKNRYPDEDGYCAIETLLASRDLSAEIRLEQIDRKAKEKQRSKPRSISAEIQAQPGDISSGGVGDERLERVRINSAFILGYLSKVTGQGSWNRKPHTFLSPFKILIRHQQKMEDEFRVLKEKFVSIVKSRVPWMTFVLTSLIGAFRGTASNRCPSNRCLSNRCLSNRCSQFLRKHQCQ